MATNYKQIHEINIFAVVLVVQSLPFLAAVGDRRAWKARASTSFAFWRSLEAKVADRSCRGRAARRRGPGADARRQAGSTAAQ